MKVSDLIEKKGSFVPAIRSDAKVQDVVDQLKADEAGALVVTDDDKKILGIISEHNIVRGLERYGRDVVDRPVTDLMTAEVVTCSMDDTMDQAMALMDHHRIRHVPVTRDGDLCGIVAIHDILRNKMSELTFEAQALRDYVSGRC